MHLPYFLNQFPDQLISHHPHFQDNMLAAAKILATEDRLPAPSEAGVYYKAVDEPDDPEHTKSSTHTIKHLVNFEGAVYECCLRDLIKIIHYIFDLLVWILSFDSSI